MPTWARRCVRFESTSSLSGETPRSICALYDAKIFSSFDKAVREMLTLQAMLATLSTGLSKVHDKDKRRVLRRGRLLLKVPALQSVQYADTLKMGKTLSEILIKNKVLKSKLQCDVAASFIASTLAVAETHWIRASGRKRLEFAHK
jgi:hypothetical protein